MSDNFRIIFTNDKYAFCGFAVFSEETGAFEEALISSAELASRIGVKADKRLADCSRLTAWLKQRMPPAKNMKAMVDRLLLTGGLCTTDEYTCFADRLPTRMVFSLVENVKGGEKLIITNRNWICTEGGNVRVGKLPIGSLIEKLPLAGVVNFVSEFGAYITLDAKKEDAQ